MNNNSGYILNKLNKLFSDIGIESKYVVGPFLDNKYTWVKSEDKVIINIANDFIDNINKNLLDSIHYYLINNRVDIKTQFGVFNVLVFDKETLYEEEYVEVLCNYILRYKIEFKELSLVDMLKTIDIGLIVSEDYVYCNIDKDTARYIYDNGSDMYLYRLACGYLEELNIFNKREFVIKYLRLCKGYKEKAKMCGVNKSLELVLKENYESYKFKTGDILEIKDFKAKGYNIIRKFIDENINREDIINTTYNVTILDRYKLSSFKVYGTIESLCEELNIDYIMLITLMVEGLSYKESLIKCIEARDKFGVGSCKITIDTDRLDRSTKYLVDFLIKEMAIK